MNQYHLILIYELKFAHFLNSDTKRTTDKSHVKFHAWEQWRTMTTPPPPAGREGPCSNWIQVENSEVQQWCLFFDRVFLKKRDVWWFIMIYIFGTFLVPMLDVTLPCNIHKVCMSECSKKRSLLKWNRSAKSREQDASKISDVWYAMYASFLQLRGPVALGSSGS